MTDETRVQASIERVLMALEHEAAQIPGSGVGQMFSDWALLLRGEEFPWELPWDVG